MTNDTTLSPDLTAKRLLDVKQVAELIGVGRRTVWRMIERGSLPRPVKFSSKVVRWPAEQITAWLAAFPVALPEPPATPPKRRKALARPPAPATPAKEREEALADYSACVLDLDPDAYVSEEWARANDLDRQELKAARESGELRYAKIGSEILYKGSWLTEWLDGPR